MADKKRQRSSNVRESSISKPEISIHLEAKPPKLTPMSREADRRGAPRYRADFEAIVFFNGVSFRTKTINVSITGALLADSIPASFVNQELDIVMIHVSGHNRDSFLVKGKALDSPLRSPRINFTLVPEAQETKLKALFLSFECTQS